MAGKIDWDHARDSVGGSVELLLEVVDIFFEECPKLIAGIESSINSGSLPELQRFAHTLKGSLRYFGETRAGELSFELEIMGRDGEIERATEVFGELKSEMETVHAELKAFVTENAPETEA